MQSKGGRSRVPTAAYYRTREEGTGRAGTLGEESLGLTYLPSSHDWCVPPKPININIGKFHCRVTCQCVQNYNSHHAWTGWDDGSCNLPAWAEPHRSCKTAVPIQECCTTCGPPAADLPHNSVSSRSPHDSVSSTDVRSYSAPIT